MSASSSSSSSSSQAPLLTFHGSVCVLVDYRERAAIHGEMPYLAGRVRWAVCNLSVADFIVCRVTGKVPGDEAAPLAWASPAADDAETGGCFSDEQKQGIAREGGVLPETLDPRLWLYEPIFAIERKAVGESKPTPGMREGSDLVSSIRGTVAGGMVNRFRDQKIRLCAFARLTGCRAYLLVEGLAARRGDRLIAGMPIESIDAALLHTHARDGIHVEHRRNGHDTARWLSALCALIVKHDMRPAPGGAVPTQGGLDSMADAVQVRKASNLTPALGFQTWLMTARGMSKPRALAIMTRYPTLCDLATAYLATSQRGDAGLLLADVDVGGGRQLGQALSRAVFRRFYGIDVPPGPEPPSKKRK